MNKELTNSQVDRQNILNNSVAMNAIREYIGLSGMLFEGEYKFTKAMLSEFYEIDFSTIPSSFISMIPSLTLFSPKIFSFNRHGLYL